MDIKELHKRFADQDSPAVEGQIRWLQKQGFAQHQIEQAMITVYSELDRGKTPMIWRKGAEIIYRSAEWPDLSSEWKAIPIAKGYDLDQYLLETAKRIRTDELSTMIQKMEEFEAGLRKKWEADTQKVRPWYRRILGK